MNSVFRFFWRATFVAFLFKGGALLYGQINDSVIPKGFDSEEETKAAALVQKLFDDRYANFDATVAAIKAIKDGRAAVPALVKALRTDVALERRSAACILSQLGHAAEAAVPDLARALADQERDVRFFSAVALSEAGIASKAVIPELNGRLVNEEDVGVRRAIGEVFAGLGKDASDAVPTLSETLLNDADEGVRVKVAIALNELGPLASPAIPALRTVLKQGPNSLRFLAARCLGKIGSDAAIATPELMEAIITSRDDPNVGSMVVSALYKIRPPAQTAVPLLTSLLADKDKNVRKCAALALEQFGADAKPAVGALIRTLEDASAETVAQGGFEASVFEALVATGPTVVDDLSAALRTDSSDSVRQWVAFTLGTMGAEARAAIPDLTDALLNTKVDISYQASLALVEIAKGLRARESTDAIQELEAAAKALTEYSESHFGDEEGESLRLAFDLSYLRPVEESIRSLKAVVESRAKHAELEARLRKAEEEARLIKQDPSPLKRLLSNSWLMTPLAAAVVILFAAIVHLLGSEKIRWGQWIGTVTTVAGSSAVTLGAVFEKLNVNFGGFVTLIVIGIAGLLGAGLLNPSVFRQLATVAPFDGLLPLALTWSGVRKQLFRQYLTDRLSVLINPEKVAERTATTHFVPEAYFTIPALRRSPGNPDESWTDPADHILEILGQGTASIAVEAPGGQGKTALLREILRRAIDRFVDDPTQQLPVLCETTADTIDASVAAALGEFRLPPKCVTRLLEDGYVFACFDRAESIADLSKKIAAMPSVLSVLIATRSADDLPVNRTWLRVEPQPLMAATATEFITHYCAVDGVDRAKFPDELLPALCNLDGKYSPIFLRLAVLVIARSPEGVVIHDIAEVYREAFKRLATDEQADDLLDKTAARAVEVYWETGARTLPHRDAPADAKTLQRELLTSGMLMASGKRVLDHDDPPTVRFFHDSFLSFLTATGLYRAQQWDALPQAAGDARFLDGGRSELFSMCVHVFSAEMAALQTTLVEQLNGWRTSRRIVRRLSEDLILDSLPPPLHDAAGLDAEPRPVGLILETAIATARRADGADGINSVATLFQGLAPVAYPAVL